MGLCQQAGETQCLRIVIEMWSQLDTTATLNFAAKQRCPCLLEKLDDGEGRFCAAICFSRTLPAPVSFIPSGDPDLVSARFTI